MDLDRDSGVFAHMRYIPKSRVLTHNIYASILLYNWMLSFYYNFQKISMISSLYASLFLGDYGSIDLGDGAIMDLVDIKTRDWSSECLKVCML